MSRPVRRIALYGFLGSGNLGNDASFETVLAWLQSAYPGVDVRCVTIAPEQIVARYGVPAELLAVRTTGSARSRTADVARKLLGRLRDVPRSFRLVGSVDAVVVPGMGVLETTLGTRPWGLPVWLFLVGAACRLRRRHFVLLDIGADDAVDPVTRALHRATARLATHISYRDAASAAAMPRTGRAAPTVVPDLAFAHPAPRETSPQPDRVVVGVMAYYGPADDPVRGAAVRQRYVSTLSQALTELVRAGTRVTLVGGDGVDTEVARAVESAVRAEARGLAHDAVTVCETATFGELAQVMAEAEVVVASRYHNLICALRLGLPTVSVGYARKNRDLMQGLGLQRYGQEIAELAAGALVAQVRAAHDEAAELRVAIGTQTKRYAGEVEALLTRVAAELGLDPQQGRAGLGRTVEGVACHGG